MSRSQRLVFLLVDGISTATLETLLDNGQLPTMARLRKEGAYHGNVVASFPTVSGPAHVPLLTGVRPTSIDLIGHNQFVRSEGRLENYLLHYRLLDRKLAKHDSLYKHFNDSVSVGEPVRVGAKAYRKNLFSLADWARIKGPANGYVLRTVVHEYRRGRDLIVAWLHETDGLAHRSPRRANIAESLARLDHWLARFLREIDENTLVLLTSDHGMEWTNTQQFVVPKALAAAGLARQRYRYFLDGGAFCQIYLKSNGNYVARQDEQVVGSLAAKLTCHPEIDLMAYRRANAEDYATVVLNARGRAVITKAGALYRYFVESGQDPLRYLDGPKGGDISSGLPAEDCHLATATSAYPDGFYQLYELLNAASSGDLILTAASGISFNALTRYAVHGGLQRGQSVTFVLANKPFSQGQTEPCLRTSDLPRLIGVLD
ncbi:MAG: alkaline phosphatase family protein [Parcubacteria group bacterium]